LGLEDRFYRDVTDHDSARKLGDLFDSTIGAPDDNSRALTAAMVGAQVELLASAPKPLDDVELDARRYFSVAPPVSDIAYVIRMRAK